MATLELNAVAEDERADSAAIQAKVDQLKKVEGHLQSMAIRSARSAILNSARKTTHCGRR